MSKFFFLNYGGPGGYWLTKNPACEADLIKECKNKYIGGQRFYNQEEFEINGLKATVHSFGIHRALRVELPSIPEPVSETVDLFEKLVMAAELFTDKEYKIFSNNCVTAVATMMNLIDKQTTPTDVVSPWSLDAHLHRYCGHYKENSTEENFIQKYQEVVSREKLDNPLFAKQKIKNLEDIIVAAYSGDKKERTKASLIELKWIKEESGFLVPTEKAPEDFKAGLIKYNLDLKRRNSLPIDSTQSPPSKESNAQVMNDFKERLRTLSSEDLSDPASSSPKPSK